MKEYEDWYRFSNFIYMSVSSDDDASSFMKGEVFLWRHDIVNSALWPQTL